LGPVSTDHELVDHLASLLPEISRVPAFPEHSLEVQLPFLRTALPSAAVLSVAFGWPDAALAERLGTTLARLADERDLLLVASSDLSHYHDHRTATRLDRRFRELLLRGSPEELVAALDRQEAEACGVGPVLTLMHYGRARRAHFEVVDQRDSSAAFGDERQVVGYLSALLLPGEGASSADRA
jgi:AmmeMemoRadiSam system protein B